MSIFTKKNRMKNNLILELIKFEIKKREVTKDSVLEKFEAVSNCDDIDKNYIDVTIDVSGFDEELIMSELITLQEYDRKPIYFDDGWETISGFISYFLYNETDKYVSLSVPVPNIIKLLEKTNLKNATN
jgi:hypothetical protein